MDFRHKQSRFINMRENGKLWKKGSTFKVVVQDKLHLGSRVELGLFKIQVFLLERFEERFPL